MKRSFLTKINSHYKSVVKANEEESFPDDHDDQEMVLEDDADLDDVLTYCDIHDDGLDVLKMYAKKFCRGDGVDAVKDCLNSFQSDVEDYAMPAVEKMLEAIDSI